MMSSDAINGIDGLSMFPVNARIAYCIRDNLHCSTRMERSTFAYDIFILLGSPPTLQAHTYSVYLASASSYIDACDAIDENIARVNLMMRVQQK